MIMKNLKFLLLLPILFFACGEDSTEFEKISSSYVSFVEGATTSIDEFSFTTSATGDAIITNQVKQVVIFRSGQDFSEAITVDFTVNGVYLDNSDFADAGDDAAANFTVSSSSVTIAAGSISSYFYVTSKNDGMSTGNKVLTITLTSVSDSDYDLGFPDGGFPNVHVLTIIEDDCPIDIPSIWEGLYKVTSFEAAPNSFNEGFAPSAPLGREVMVELDASDPSGTSVLLKGGATPNLFIEDVPMKFETCDETVLIGEDLYFMNFSQNDAPAGIARADEPNVYGNGSYKGDGSQFTITATFTNDDGANFDEFNIIFDRSEEQ